MKNQISIINFNGLCLGNSSKKQEKKLFIQKRNFLCFECVEYIKIFKSFYFSFINKCPYQNLILILHFNLRVNIYFSF